MDAYIVKSSGDSAKGQLRLHDSGIFGKNVIERLGDGLDFREKGSKGNFIFYTPGQISEFGYYKNGIKYPQNPVRYVSETIDKKKRFVIISIDGPCVNIKMCCYRKSGQIQ